MICRKCGSEIRENAKFCPSCGEIVEKKKEKANVFLVILSVILPIVGFILFLVKRKSDPKNSKSCGIACAAGMIAWMVIIITALIASVFFTFNFFGGIFGNMFDNINDVRTKNEEKNINYNAKPWEDYTLTYDGKSFTLPISYEEFSNITGYELNEEDEERNIKKGKCFYGYVFKDDLKLSLVFCSGNRSRKKFKNATVIEVTQSYSDEGNDELLMFPRNIKIIQKMTENELKKLLGEPTLVKYQHFLTTPIAASYYYSLNPKKIHDSKYVIDLGHSDRGENNIRSLTLKRALE